MNQPDKPKIQNERLIPPLQFGSNILEHYAEEFQNALIVTMELPWDVAKKRLKMKNANVLFVQDVERTVVETIEHNAPSVETIIGLGGGTALDVAKYLAWRRRVRLILVPSIMSVDACVTRSIAVREGKRVRYVGDVKTDVVIVDYELIRSAPANLNRAGAGDILSIHTALFDWKLAHELRDERHDPDIANSAKMALQRLHDGWRDIRDVTNDGIRLLAELFADVNELCLRFGNSRPEEGSEHFWAYNVEFVTGKQYIHGDLVSLGIILMAALQENEPDQMRQFLEKAGLQYRPDQLHLSEDDIVRSLATLKSYVESERLMFTVINAARIDTKAINRLLSRFF